MEGLLIVLIVVLLLMNVGVLFFLFSKKPEEGKGEGMQLLNDRIAELSRTLDTKLGEGTDRMFESMKSQFSESQRLANDIRDTVSKQLLEVAKGVSETKESTRQVFTIAEQLKNLEKVLKNQKQRGNLGEASLELILSNVLPGQYESQYQFKDGAQVDVVIKTKEGLVPVDAKFPLENYLRLVDEVDELRKEEYKKMFKADVKKQIDQTSKYIRPEEGTMPFAFMFIPAEGIYYDLLTSDVGTGVNAQDLIEYAYKQKNVLISSPTTFLAYLQTVLFGNQRIKVQEAAKDIIKNVAKLDKHLKAYEEQHQSLGKSLQAAQNHFEKSNKSFQMIDKDVLRITEEASEIDIQSLQGPDRE